MGVTFRTRVDKFPPMQQAVKLLDGKGVNVGVFDGAQAHIAMIQEYGCDIVVTEKMEAYLHYQGIHLNPATHVITIPERSFLRAGFDEHADFAARLAERMLPDVLAGSITVDALIEAVGEILASKIRDYAIQLSDPPNAPATVKLKGRSNPLVDTGDMVGAISFRPTSAGEG